MARANGCGWDFVKVGNVYQYKEEGCISMVLVTENTSSHDYYNFKVKVLASDGAFPPGEVFTVSHSKEPGGFWNNMMQFYESPEYLPIPIGTPWPKYLTGHEYEGIK